MRRETVISKINTFPMGYALGMRREAVPSKSMFFPTGYALGMRRETVFKISDGVKLIRPT